MTQITKNFTLEEFQAHGFPTSPTPKEMFLLRKLCLKLQTAREVLGCPIQITDCYRTVEKYQELLSNGYHPSETSDHFWGQRIPISNPDKVEKYGKVFELSVGAVDFTISTTSVMDIFKAYSKIKDLVDGTNKNRFIEVGQLIVEQSATAKWIHISNPASVLYSESAARVLFPVRTQFLTSNDGGKTYTAVV